MVSNGCESAPNVRYSISTQENKAVNKLMKDENTTRNQCGALCEDGSRCQRRQEAQQCYLHRGEQPENHGAPSENTNAVKHGLAVDTDKYVHEVLSPPEAQYLFTVYRGLLRQSEVKFNTSSGVVKVDGKEIERPVANSNVETAHTLFEAAVALSKSTRASVKNVENDYLSEDGENIGYLNAELSTLLSKMETGMAEV